MCQAVYFVRNGPPPADSSNEKRLKYYALFKQATEGEVSGSQPWAVQLEARAKWDAWNGVKGTSKEDAMKQYAALVDEDTSGWESDACMKGFSA